MKYALDRIENNIAILENLNTKEKKEVPLSELPQNIEEGSILEFKENVYNLDSTEETERRQRIMDKFNKLKK